MEHSTTNIRISGGSLKRFKRSKKSYRGLKFEGMAIRVTHDTVYNLGLNRLDEIAEAEQKRGASNTPKLSPTR